MWKWLIGALAAASMFFWWNNADAQDRKCQPVDQIIEMLTEKYEEIPIANMVDAKHKIPMQLWANLETGSWTMFFIIGSDADTKACYLDEGSNFAIGGIPRS